MTEASYYIPSGMAKKLSEIHVPLTKELPVDEIKVPNEKESKRSKKSKRSSKGESPHAQGRDDIDTTCTHETSDFATSKLWSPSDDRILKNPSSPDGRLVASRSQSPSKKLSPRTAAFSNTRTSDGSRGSSPRRELQTLLPPPNLGDQVSEKQTLQSEIAELTAKSTYLTRKAQRFSSLKKVKPGGTDKVQSSNSLLTRLFFTPESTKKVDKRHMSENYENMKVISDQRMMTEGVRDKEFSRSSTRTTQVINDDDEMESTRKKSVKRQPNKANYRQFFFDSPSIPKKQTTDECNRNNIALIADVRSKLSSTIQSTSGTVTRDAETNMKHLVRSAFPDVFLEACLTSGNVSHSSHASPPTYSTQNKLAEVDKKNDASPSKTNYFVLYENNNLVGSEQREANEDSTEIEFHHSRVNSRSPRRSPSEAGSPSRKDGNKRKSAKSSEINEVPSISPTKSKSPSKNRMVKDSGLEKDFSRAFGTINDSNISKETNNKTPGRIVIPPTFLSTSVKHMIDEMKLSSSSSSSSHNSERKQSSTASSSALQVAHSKVALALDQGGDKTVGATRVEIIRANRALSPPRMVRLTSSLEDLATVPEASSSKETGSFSTPKGTLSDDFSVIDNVLQGDSMQISGTDQSERKRKGDSRSSKGMDTSTEKNHKRQNDGNISQIVEGSISMALSNHEIRELMQLKVDYERKLNEQKDQVSLANRLAKIRLEEIERLDAEKKLMSVQLTASGNSELEEVKKELAEVKDKLRDKEISASSYSFHEAEFDRLRKELERVKSELHTKDKATVSYVEYEKVQGQLVEVQQKLENKEKQISINARGELNRVRKELSEVKETLARKEKEESAKTPSKEISRLQKELTVVKKELEHANKRASENDNKLDMPVQNNKSDGIELPADIKKPQTDGDEIFKMRQELEEKEVELLSVKQKLLSLSSLSPTSMKMSASNKQGSDKLRDSELIEREKQMLQEQVALMELQTTKTCQDHEKALQELREASEQEIFLVKKDMESRIAHHLDKERSLKESLSCVSSREKEDLLDQIERLEAEKKIERSGGLREVQRKEELLSRISLLEKKQKEAAEEHDRAMQELRSQNEIEINRLIQQTKKREDQQIQKENELLSSISETSSFEKQDLLHKIENLENQLDSERSGSVLLKIKVGNFEKDLAASEELHRKAFEDLEKEKKVAQNELRHEKDENMKLVETLRVSVEEKETVEAQLTAMKATHINEINRLHAERERDIKTEIEKRQGFEIELQAAVNEQKALEAELVRLKEELSMEQQKSKSSSENLSKDYLERIDALMKEMEEHKALRETQTSDIQSSQETIDLLKKMIDVEQQERHDSILKLRTEYENEIDSIRNEKKSQASDLQAGLEKIDLLKAENTEKESYIAKLRMEYENQIDSIKNEKERQASEHKACLDKIDHLKAEINEKEKNLENLATSSQQDYLKEKERMKDEIGLLMNQITLLNEQHEDKEKDLHVRMQAAEGNYDEECKRLRTEMEAFKTKRDQADAKVEEKFKKDLKSQEQKFSFEKRRLLDQIDVMKSQIKDNEKSLDDRLQLKDFDLKKKLEEAENSFSLERQELLRQILQVKIAQEEEKVKMRAEFDEKMTVIENKFSDEKVKLLEEIELLDKQKREIEAEIEMKVNIRVKDKETEFDDEKKKLSELIDTNKADLVKYESKLSTIQEEHTKELDEVLSQLDLVEAEHQDAVARKEQIISEKEGIITALGVQLGEAQRRTNAIDQKLAEQSEEVESLQLRLRSTCNDLLECNSALHSAKEAHQLYVKDSEISRTKACDEAREEMIQRAEVQFQQANEHYVKLRKQYEASQNQISKLESKIKDITKKLDICVKERDSCEINLKAEIAQLKSSRAKTEADAAQMAREYRREMDRLIQTAKDFEARAHETEVTSRNIQTTLATVVSDKERLQQEYEEMKSVSEELLAMVEGQQQQQRRGG